MTPRIHVAILGASGYGAGELLRLFVQHPHVEVVSVISTSQAGVPISAVHSHLRGFYDGHTNDGIDWERMLAGDHAVVFSALPHGVSAAALEAILDQAKSHGAGETLRLIDLSGDLRLRDAEQHRRYYPETPALADLRRDFVYGLPELNHESVRTARWIANPGCLATASILAAAPLVSSGFTGTVAIDAKTGSSGSGRTLKDATHHPTRHGDFRAYKPLAHQHEPEILQAWGDLSGERISTSFVAQSMDVTRGIFATAHLTLPGVNDSETLRRRYEDYYAESPFVRVVEGSPRLQDVVGSNFCDVGVACRGRQVIAMAALDNLVKGMAGAAIQNMNLMCGLPETAGLWLPSLLPV